MNPDVYPFDGLELAIRRKCKADERFRAVWQDFVEVREGLARLAGDPSDSATVLRHYQRIERELRRELQDMLEQP